MHLSIRSEPGSCVTPPDPSGDAPREGSRKLYILIYENDAPLPTPALGRAARAMYTAHGHAAPGTPPAPPGPRKEAPSTTLTQEAWALRASNT